MLTGWRCPKSNLWRIPLVNCVITNDNTQTLLLSENFQLQYPQDLLPTTAHMLERINVVTEAPTDTINNVYELPIIEHAVRYLHGAAGFPTKATWLRAICNNTFISWPLINVKNVNKHFPESEETQKGHMRNLHQNTRSTTRTAKNNNTPQTADATRFQYVKTDFSLGGGSAAQISKPPEHPKISKPIEKKSDMFI